MYDTQLLSKTYCCKILQTYTEYILVYARAVCCDDVGRTQSMFVWVFSYVPWLLSWRYRKAIGRPGMLVFARVYVMCVYVQHTYLSIAYIMFMFIPKDRSIEARLASSQRAYIKLHIDNLYTRKSARHSRGLPAFR